MSELARRAIRQVRLGLQYCWRLDRRAEESPVPITLLVCGLGVGLTLCAVFAASWKYYGDIYFTEWTRLRLVPSVMVVLVLTVLNFKQLAGLAVTADRLVLGTGPSDQPTTSQIRQISLVGVLAVVLALLLKFSLILAMPYHAPWWPDDWRAMFNRLYPKMHFRVLLLLGLWGKAGLLVAAATGWQSPTINPQDRDLRRRLRIRPLLVNLVLVTLVTAVYFSSQRSRGLGLLVALWIFLVVYVASMLLSRAQRGHDKHSMFACAELAEQALLLAYLAISKFLYQP